MSQDEKEPGALAPPQYCIARYGTGFSFADPGIPVEEQELERVARQRAEILNRRIELISAAVFESAFRPLV
jgi:hypothetical protein